MVERDTIHIKADELMICNNVNCFINLPDVEVIFDVFNWSGQRLRWDYNLTTKKLTLWSRLPMDITIECISLSSIIERKIDQIFN